LTRESCPTRSTPLYRREEITPGACLPYISLSANCESLIHYSTIKILCQEQNDGSGRNISDFFRGGNSVHPGHSNIEKNHVGLVCSCSLNGLESVARLTNNLPFRTRLQYVADLCPPSAEVIGDENG